jgi:rare lipoprotein A
MRTINTIWLCAALLTGAISGSALAAGTGTTAISAPKTEAGLASYYHDKYHGRQTASGEIFNTNEFTAAHRTLAFGTVVRVTHAESRRSVVVRINDRGPFISGRVIDLSRAAARELGIEKAGLAKVNVEIIPPAATTTRR